MNKQQKKFQKKKDREKLVRKKVLVQREEIRAEKSAQRREELRLEEEFKLRNGTPEPFLKDPAAIAAREERKKANVEVRLKKNLAILEALEKEFDKEQTGRSELNEALSAEGHKTVKEKLEAIQNLGTQAKLQALLQKTKKKNESVEWFHGDGENRGISENVEK